MAYPTDFTNYTRPQWGGAASDVDIHIEEHLGIVDASFQYTSKFASLANIRTLRGTNQLRLDRVGAATVQGRKAGEELDVTPVRNDKMNLIVDTVLYVRNEFDKFDQWTANPDLRKEVGREHGFALARQFDQACLGQLQKAADWTAPAHLAGAFHDGIKTEATVTGTTSADADILVAAHREGVEELINRDLGDMLSSNGVTYVSPKVFTVLLNHNKLMAVEFGAGGSNSFVGGRIGYMNGIKVVETPRFAQAAITNSALGAEHNLTAEEVKRQMVTFIPSLALVAASVHPVNADYWEDKRQFSHVLDTYQSYNIGQRRPDAVSVVSITGLP